MNEKKIIATKMGDYALIEVMHYDNFDIKEWYNDFDSLFNYVKEHKNENIEFSNNLSENEKRVLRYAQTGSYTISSELYDVSWNDKNKEWKMAASTKGMRSCAELDKVERELDEFGYEIVLKEFNLPRKYKLKDINHANPLALEKLREV
ncbi:MAG: hypothetical protein QMD14_01800 [Candidatus Aenigmarchaeota archaeon]|nr:hypothetical protein [Candidatus Aenigmarchaeota archaeon]